MNIRPWRKNDYLFSMRIDSQKTMIAFWSLKIQSELNIKLKNMKIKIQTNRGNSKDQKGKKCEMIA